MKSTYAFHCFEFRSGVIQTPYDAKRVAVKRDGWGIDSMQLKQWVPEFKYCMRKKIPKYFF